MDDICTLPPQDLYQKALTNDIPFHQVSSTQWYQWIEDELKDIYVKMTDKKQLRKMERMAVESVKSRRKK